MAVYLPAPEGDKSPGVASGGLKGQYLRKASDLDYDTDWEDVVAGEGGGSSATNLSYDAATRTIASDTGTDATLPLVTSSDAGLVPATGGGTTNFLRADGTFAAPPTSPPGGTSGQLQFNDGGSFGGVASSSVDVDGNVTLRTATVNAPSGYTGNLLDLQRDGTSKAYVDKDGRIFGRHTAYNLPAFNVINAGGLGTNGSSVRLIRASTSRYFGLESDNAYDFNNEVKVYTNADVLEQRRTTNAQTYRVYNTYTSSTNYERAKIEWSSNTLRIGTEKGSAGGTARDMELQTDGTTRITVKSDGAILFSGLPTSDPAVANQLWNDGGTLKISAG